MIIILIINYLRDICFYGCIKENNILRQIKKNKKTKTLTDA